MAIIDVQNVYKSLQLADQKIDILNGINLSVEAGESIAIVGKSGSGKSTFLSLLAGLDVASAGHIYLHGNDLSALSEDGRAKVRHDHVGFIFQNFQLLPHLSALDNVMLPLELSFQANAKEIATQWLTKVGLAERLDHQPNQLSGGEQQRVAIARAFACNPDILFADEPTGNLDENTGQSIIDLLFELNNQHNITLVLVTHDDDLAKLCKRQVHLEEGVLREEAEVL